MHDFVSSIFDYDLHAKRVDSLADATVGALQGARLAVAALGRALAVAKDLDAKHAIKQVDRFFSNTGVDVSLTSASPTATGATGTAPNPTSVSPGAGNDSFAFGLSYEQLKAISDFAAGFGDVVSLGLSNLVWNKMGTNQVVNKSSGAYSGGEWAGIAHSALTGLAAGIRAAGVKAAGKGVLALDPNPPRRSVFHPQRELRISGAPLLPRSASVSAGLAGARAEVPVPAPAAGQDPERLERAWCRRGLGRGRDDRE